MLRDDAFFDVCRLTNFNARLQEQLDDHVRYGSGFDSRDFQALEKLRSRMHQLLVVMNRIELKGQEPG